LDLNLRRKLVKCYIWGMALYGAETWTLQKVDQKYLEYFGMWCWRRMKKISWANHVSNEKVLQRIKKERNILHTIKGRKGNWICHILCMNCLPIHIIEVKKGGKMEQRRGRRHKQLVDDLNEGKGYCKLKEETLNRTLWISCFGRGYGPVIR